MRGRHTGFGVACTAILLLVILRLWQIGNAPPELPVDQAKVRVLRVVDGDTIVVEGERRVRLLGVDTPETKHPEKPQEPFGPEATQFTKQLVEGQEVLLVFDRERYDDYHRILAYVYIENTLLNEELVRSGLATAETQYPYRSDMKRRFLNAEKEAQAAKRGIWSLDLAETD